MPPITFSAWLWFLAMWVLTQFTAKYVSLKWPDSAAGKALGVLA